MFPVRRESNRPHWQLHTSRQASIQNRCAFPALQPCSPVLDIKPRMTSKTHYNDAHACMPVCIDPWRRSYHNYANSPGRTAILTVWPMNLARRFCRTRLHSASELLPTSTDWQSGLAPTQVSAWLPALNFMTSAPVAASSANTMQSAPTLYTSPLLPAPAAYAREATPLQDHHRQ